MKTSLLMGLLVLAATQAFAAESPATPRSATPPMTCGTPDLLQSLAQAIATTNQLATNLNYAFDDVRTISSNYRRGKLVSMKCAASLKLINRDDQKTTDALKLTYSLKEDGKGGYTLSFEPQR